MKSLLIFSFLFLSTQVLAESVHIYCYYADTKNPKKSFKYFEPVDDGKTPVVEAQYESGLLKSGYYKTKSRDLERMMKLCAEQTEKGFSFQALRASTPKAKALYDYYLGFLTYHYPLISSDAELKIQQAVKIFDTIPASFEHKFDMEKDDLTRHLVRMSSGLDNLTEESPAEAFLTISDDRGSLGVFSVDFLRSSTRVYQKGHKIFEKVQGRYYDPTTGQLLRTVESGDPVKDLKEEVLFANFLRGEVMQDNGLLRVSQLDLRKRIAKALETRTQTFEATSYGYLTQKLAKAMPEGMMTNIKEVEGKEEEGMRHTITIEDGKLILESDFEYYVNLTEERVPIGLISSHRRCEMDLSTGHFSPETITFKKH